MCPFDETQDLHWLRKTPSTLAQFASTARSLANHEASGSVQSATTHSLVAHGNLSHVHLMRTTEFYDDPWKALQPPTWHSSLNKPLWITNVHWLLAKSLKKSEASSAVNTVSSKWILTLEVQASTPSETKALGDALTTDESIEWNEERTSFSFTLNESKAKDLRAMWNTRIRGLIAVDSLFEALKE